jgi:hypothetical protein
MTNQTLTLQDIGSYGREWIDFMEGNHPQKVREMQEDGRFLEVAQSVDDEAWAYDELLTNQYLKAHPYPNTYEENVRYHRTKNFHVEGAVIREKVLIPITTV